MKIGIMTFWWSEDNYGQLLQCYALQKYLRELGHDAYVIKYNHFADVVRKQAKRNLSSVLNPKNLLKFLQSKYQSYRLNKYNEINKRHFSTFRSNNIHFSEKKYNSLNELRLNPPPADIYIVGSDQVWNFRFRNIDTQKNPIHAYMLDFGREGVKRVSYAASCCYSTLDERYKNEIIPLLNRFDAISVREADGLTFCNDFGRNDAQVVLDPTFLLKAKDYRLLYKNNNFVIPDTNYVFLYMINDNNSFDVKKIYRWANEKKLKVVYVTANSNTNYLDKQLFATIEQWLNLIDNAEYVITNSFHCCVFSILFKKQFAVIPRKGDDISKGMNTRMEGLFEICSTNNRYLTDFDVLNKQYIVNEEKFSKLRENSVNFLNKTISLS